MVAPALFGFIGRRCGHPSKKSAASPLGEARGALGSLAGDFEVLLLGGEDGSGSESGRLLTNRGVPQAFNISVANKCRRMTNP